MSATAIPIRQSNILNPLLQQNPTELQRTYRNKQMVYTAFVVVSIAAMIIVPAGFMIAAYVYNNSQYLFGLILFPLLKYFFDTNKIKAINFKEKFNFQQKIAAESKQVFRQNYLPSEIPTRQDPYPKATLFFHREGNTIRCIEKRCSLDTNNLNGQATEVTTARYDLPLGVVHLTQAQEYHLENVLANLKALHFQASSLFLQAESLERQPCPDSQTYVKVNEYADQLRGESAKLKLKNAFLFHALKNPYSHASIENTGTIFNVDFLTRLVLKKKDEEALEGQPLLNRFFVFKTNTPPLTRERIEQLNLEQLENEIFNRRT